MSTKLEPGDVLFGKTRRRVLGLLFGHADEAFYVRQIIRRSGQSPGAVQRELDALARADLVERTSRGNQVYFQANRQSPVFAELHSLVLKTAGIAEVVRQALVGLHGQITAAFIYGSAARASLRKSSDIDLFVVGAVDFGDLVAALRPAQQQVGREINPTVYEPDEFAQKVQAQSHFVMSLRTEPRTFIIGDDRALGRLEAKWMADRAHDERRGDSRPARSRGTRPRRQRSGRAQR